MKIVLTFLFFIFVFIATDYIAFAFVEYEFNPKLWTLDKREWCAAIASTLILFSLIIAIFIIIDRNDL